MSEPVVDRVSTTLLHQTEAATMVLGDRLGLWAALAPAALTCDEVAGVTGVAPRYAREWCEAMATSGYLDHAAGRFQVTAEAVPVLVDRASPTYLMPLLRQMAAAAASLRDLERVYRTGEGFAWASYDVDMRVGQGDGNAVALRDDLPGWVADHLPDVANRLRAGGARIADALAVTVHHRAVGPADGPYDLVVMAEMLHDVPDPVGLLRGVATTLAPGGVVFVADMAAADTLQAPGGETERLLYGFSLLVCLPDSLATPGSAATGTVMRRGTFAGYVQAAGLAVREELPIAHDIWRFSVLERAG